MLSNLPIICTNYGYVCEIVEDGRDGVWVDPFDVDAISRAIEQLASDNRLRAELSRHRYFKADAFSIETVNKQEAAFYLTTIRDYEQSRARSENGRFIP